jgi:hypothetical protein
MSDYILHALTDAEIDEVEVRRKLAPAAGLANEPVTIGIVIVASIKAATAIAGAITAYLQLKAKQAENEAKAGATANDGHKVILRVLDGEIPDSIKKLSGAVLLDTGNKK